MDSPAAEQPPASAVALQPGGFAVEEPAFPAAGTLAAAAEAQHPAVAGVEAEQVDSVVAAHIPAVAVAAEPAFPAADCLPAAAESHLDADSAGSGAEADSGAVAGLACDPADSSADPAVNSEAAALVGPLAAPPAQPVAVPADDCCCPATGSAGPADDSSAGRLAGPSAAQVVGQVAADWYCLQADFGSSADSSGVAEFPVPGPRGLPAAPQGTAFRLDRSELDALELPQSCVPAKA